MSAPVRYKAFISYSHKDEAWAVRLQRRFESFKLPSETGDARWPLRPTFLDRSEFASSPNLSDAVNQALAASEALVVVCSPDAAASKWVNEEILTFKRLGKTAVYAMVVAGEPGAGVPGTECFPDALKFRLGEDGELSASLVEPLAADARRQADGSAAYLKLIAGLLDVPFDTLRSRQHRKQIRQALAIAAGATAMLVVTSFLAVTAYFAQQDAERKRDQAENLITFMLGDLRERLEPVGRLDVLDGVGEQALAYFSTLSESELTSEALLTRATALRQIGEVRVAQGLIDEGLVAFNEARDVLESANTDNEGARLFELGQIHFWIADAYFNDLRLDKAREHIEQYLSISRELVQVEPDNTDFQTELMYAESNLGTLAYRANDMAKAREYFNNALAMGQALASHQPAEDYDYDVADTISWLGAVEASSGNFAAASDWYRQQIAIRRALLATQETPSSKHLLARALFLYGDTLQQTGEPAAAYAASRESAQVFRELVAYDPQNYDWQRELAWTLTLLARDGFNAELLNAPDARSTLRLAAEAMGRVDEQVTAETARVFAAIDTELARIELEDGNSDVATERAQGAVTYLVDFIATADRVRVLPIFAKASYLLSEARSAAGDSDESVTVAESALEQLAIRENDPIEVVAYAALLSYQAKHPAADDWLAIIERTDYNARAYVTNSAAGQWWTSRIARANK